MDKSTSELVRGRAGNCCEYCHLPQHASALRFHVEHIVAGQHGGADNDANLALACPECNFQKGTNLSGIDPDTGAVSPLFHPRRDQWAEHFARDGARIVGKTATAFKGKPARPPRLVVSVIVDYLLSPQVED